MVLNDTAWKQIADEIDDARIYAGSHLCFDQEAGPVRDERSAGPSSGTICFPYTPALMT